MARSSSLWYPFTQMSGLGHEDPLTIVRGKGVYLFDAQEKRYMDGVSSLWTNVHGHGHPALNSAIHQQLSYIAHSTLLGLSNEPAEKLADRLAELAPRNLTKVFYSDSGSTAVEIALKQSFQFWQQSGKPTKSIFVHLENSYHGDTMGAVAVGGIPIFHKIFGRLMNEAYSIPSPVGNFGRRDDSLASVGALRTLLAKRSNEISGVIVEPLVQGAGGILVHPRGYLKSVAKLCKQFDVHLIVDEVATGFGRTGKLFACEHEEVEPDFMCLAKGISGGYLPLAATLSSDRIFEAFLSPSGEPKAFFHGHTYTGNPLACAAALASLDLFKEEDTLSNVRDRAEQLASLLEGLLAHDRIISIRQRGLMAGIEFVASKKPAKAFEPSMRIGHKLSLAVRNHGLILRNLGDVLVIMPPLSITGEEIAKLVESLKLAIADVFDNNSQGSVG